MYTLYSFATPNGIKPTIMLEELKQPYTVQMVDISNGEQFAPDFLTISPNNKIPVLHDQSNDFYMFESVAILQYLAEKYGQFLPKSLKEKYNVLQWCYFQAAHIGPMFGQFGYFHRYAPEPVPYAMHRYENECLRLMGVMERQLSQHPYISGSEYTIADMAIWPWLYCYQFIYETPIDVAQFSHLMAWYHELGQRQAVKDALAIYGKT